MSADAKLDLSSMMPNFRSNASCTAASYSVCICQMGTGLGFLPGWVSEMSK